MCLPEDVEHSAGCQTSKHCSPKPQDLDVKKVQWSTWCPTSITIHLYTGTPEQCWRELLKVCQWEQLHLLSVSRWVWSCLCMLWIQHICFWCKRLILWCFIQVRCRWLFTLIRVCYSDKDSRNCSSNAGLQWWWGRKTYTRHLFTCLETVSAFPLRIKRAKWKFHTETE